MQLQAGADCPRYCGRVIEGLNPAARSPLWLTEKLAFPESSPYVDTLLKRLEGSMPGATKENPA